MQLFVYKIYNRVYTEPEIVEKTEKITSYGYVVKNSCTTVLDASVKMAFKLFHANYLTEKNMKHQHITLNSIGDGVISTDKEGLVVDINPVAQQLTGWNLLEARGIRMEILFRIIAHEDRTVKILLNPALTALISFLSKRPRFSRIMSLFQRLLFALVIIDNTR